MTFVCPRCGRQSVFSQEAEAPRPVQAVRGPTAGTYSPAPTYTPPTAPAPPIVAPAGPARTSMQAILALVFGVLAFIGSFPFALLSNIGPEFTGLGVFGILGPGFAIAAIVLGALGMKDCRQPNVKGRGMAITGLVLGIVYLGILVLTILFIAIVCAAYVASYGKTFGIAAPCPAVALQHAATHPDLRKKARFRLLLAHHPECGAFRHDVLPLGGARLCASCVALVAAATLAAYALWFLSPSAERAWLLLAAGIPAVLIPQGLSALRWTTTKARKMWAKATIGTGVVLALWGLYVAPWSEGVRLAVLGALALLAVLLIVPRRKRLQDEMTAHRHGPDCGPVGAA